MSVIESQNGRVRAPSLKRIDGMRRVWFIGTAGMVAAALACAVWGQYFAVGQLSLRIKETEAALSRQHLATQQILHEQDRIIANQTKMLATQEARQSQEDAVFAELLKRGK